MTLLAVALVVSGVCARLGFWQLERLGERRAHNNAVLSTFQRSPLPLDSLRGALEQNVYRRVIVRGQFDSSHEFVLANRPRRGSPGVYLLTPLLRDGSDTAVMVIRGWVYAADATHAETEEWREHAADGATGYVRLYEHTSSGAPTGETSIVRSLDHSALATRVPYPLAPYLVVLTRAEESAGAGRGGPPRLDEPTLGEGNHMMYAFQWFAFAAIALAGGVVFVRHTHRARIGGTDQDFEPQ